MTRVLTGHWPIAYCAGTQTSDSVHDVSVNRDHLLREWGLRYLRLVYEACAVKIDSIEAVAFEMRNLSEI